MREAKGIMRDKNMEDMDHCDFRQLVKERLENQTLKAKSTAANEWRTGSTIISISAANKFSLQYSKAEGLRVKNQYSEKTLNNTIKEVIGL